MSLKSEQYYSLLITREFLYDLMNSKKRPKTVKELKLRASRCLWHYPMLNKNGMPIFSNDNFTDENGDMKILSQLNDIVNGKETKEK